MKQMKVNAKLLKKKIHAAGYTMKSFSGSIGMSYSTLHRKIKESAFTAGEMQAITDALQLRDPAAVFFWIPAEFIFRL